jgi:ribonuclease R
VEEFMLSANRAVARFLIGNDLPGLYRVHDEPLEEDLEEFRLFIRSVLNRRVDATSRKALQDLLDEVADSHLAEAVNMQLLRTMQRAVYSTQPSPHYALAFDRYCHFTSPVRRYPDLVVHQVLDEYLTRNRHPAQIRNEMRDRLAPIAEHCNVMQQRADDAEREIVKIKLLRFLEDHADEVFEALITGVQEYGFFVRLKDYLVEGLVKVRDLHDDFYKLDERAKALVGTRTGRTFQLGQSLQVTLSDIDMARRQADFLLHRES